MNAIALANSANPAASTDSPLRQYQLPPQSQRSSKQHLLPPSSGSGQSSSALASLARGSLIMGLSGETNPNPNASSTSLGLVSTHSGLNGHTPTGESSNMIIGPNGVLVPRSSILLNRSNRKSLVDNWRVKGQDGNQPAPAVLRIPAVPTLKEQKERELQREFERAEREREIEREVREKEQAEKVWGIPRKAFYLGLGEINFNAQMAMLGGWGNGSGGMGVDVANRTPLTSKATRRKSTPVAFGGSLSKKPTQKTKSGRPSSSHGSIRKGQESIAAAPKAPPKEPEESDSDESMDLEELAALNAIINTRRSMEAAQALASGMYAARPIAAIKRSVSSNEALRKSMEVEAESRPMEESKESMESVPTSMSVTASAANESESDHAVLEKPKNPRHNSDSLASYSASSRIRFAPLPQTYTASQALVNGEEDSSQPAGINVQNGVDTYVSSATKETDRSTEEVANASSKASPTKEREDVELEIEEEMEGDESWTRRWSGSKSSKWYLMGMPKSVFSPHYYRTLRRPMSSGSHDSSMTATQINTNSASLAMSDSERRGRRRSRSKRMSNSRASSIKSRSSSIGSLDEEDRDRRRQLILASRPGGTGMVTLPDGRKIRARRVGEAYSDDEGDQTQASTEVGLGALAKAAERQGLIEDERQTGEKRMSDDERGRESDFGEEVDDDRDSIRAIAKMKRRKREASMETSITPAEDESVFHSDSTQEATNDTVLQSTQKKANAEKESDEAVTPIAVPADESDSDSINDEEADQLTQSISRLDGEKLLQGRMPKRSTTMPSGPITLSASQAAEVRRRHEEEVAALGAEVLHNIAKAKKAKQMQYDHQQQQQQQQQTSTRQQAQHQKGVADKSGHQEPKLLRSHTMHHTGQSNSSGLPTHSTLKNTASPTDRGRGRDVRSRTQTSAEDDVHLRKDGKHSRLSPLRHSLRSKQRTQSVHVGRAARQNEISKQASNDVLGSIRRPDRKGTDSSSSVSRLPRVSTPPRLQSDTDSRPITPTRRTMDDEYDVGNLTSSISSVRTLRGAGDLITDLPLQSSPLSQGAVSPTAIHSLHSLHGSDVQSPSAATASMPNVALDSEEIGSTIDSQLVDSPASSLRTASIRSFRRSRIPDLPSPWDLPRRPDARGYAVVPLPGNQLGRRPDRPREGRFWQSDEEDGEEEEEDYSSTEDEMTKSHARPLTQNKIRSQIDSDDEQDSDMDAEQLAEEERRTAVQKKRATTRAAGAELVSGLSANLTSRSATRLNQKRSTSANRLKDRQMGANGKYVQSPSSLPRKSAEFPISGKASLQHRHSKSSNHSVTTNGSSRGDANNDGKNARPILSRTVVSTSRDRKGNHVAKITRERDTWNDFDDHDGHHIMTGKTDVIPKLKAEEEDGDSSDVDDLWPPTLDNALGGSPLPRVLDLPSPVQIPLKKSTSRPNLAARSAKSSTSLSSSIGSGSGAMISPIGDVNLASSKTLGHSPTTPNSSSSNHLPSTSTAIRLAMHATKAKIVREKREKEQREREREQRKQAREMDESIDYGWPKSLQGSSLY